MKLSKATRITIIIVAGVVVLGLAGLSVLSGSALDLGEILKIIVAGAGSGIAGYLSGRAS